MVTLLGSFKVFGNPSYETLVAQDDVHHLGKMVESLIIEFDQAKLAEMQAPTSKRTSTGGANSSKHNSLQSCVSDSEIERDHSCISATKRKPIQERFPPPNMHLFSPCLPPERGQLLKY